MKVHTYEKAFLTAGALVLVGCLLALGYSTFVMGMHLPGDEGRIHPAEVTSTPPFDAPGVRELAPGRYEAVLIGQAWSFIPQEIRVPAGAEVVFTATATDVIHGFNVEGTRMNMMLIPGQISRASYRFEEPGEYLLICHEYCGVGHHFMAGRLIVEPADDAVASASAAR